MSTCAGMHRAGGSEHPMARCGFSQTAMSCDTAIEDAPSIKTFAYLNVLFQGQYSSTCKGRSGGADQDALNGSDQTRTCTTAVTTLETLFSSCCPQSLHAVPEIDGDDSMCNKWFVEPRKSGDGSNATHDQARGSGWGGRLPGRGESHQHERYCTHKGRGGSWDGRCGGSVDGRRPETDVRRQDWSESF
jgi:hypothetical protein